MDPAAATALLQACSIAEKALDAVEVKRSVPAVTLVKVASSSCYRIAKALHDKGAFPDITLEKLASTLQTADPPVLLTLLEKLASRTLIFDTPTPGTGALVPKPGQTPARGGINGAFDAAAAEYRGQV